MQFQTKLSLTSILKPWNYFGVHEYTIIDPKEDPKPQRKLLVTILTILIKISHILGFTTVFQSWPIFHHLVNNPKALMAFLKF